MHPSVAEIYRATSISASISTSTSASASTSTLGPSLSEKISSKSEDTNSSILTAEAELVDHGEYDHNWQEEEDRQFFDEAATERHSGDTGNLVPVSGFGNDEGLATEATVIESGDPEKATIAAWSGHAAEGVVLDEEVAIECKQLSNNGGSDDFDAFASVGVQNNAIATVVNYNIHPSDTTDQSVQAEFISTNVLGSDEVDGISTSINVTESAIAITETEHATEATVIDSGDPDKATEDAWSTPAGEAHVLQESYVGISVSSEGRTGSSSTIASVGSTLLNTGSNNGLAEIVGISEEFVHPAEFESEAAATAQLIGSEACNQHLLDSTIRAPDIQNTQNIAPAAVMGIDENTSDAPRTPVRNSLATASRDCRTFSENNSHSSDSIAGSESVRAPSIICGDKYARPTNPHSRGTSIQSNNIDSERSIEDPPKPQPRPFSSNAKASIKKILPVMKNFFGDIKPSAKSFEMDDFTSKVLPRQFLPTDVIYSDAQKLWKVTIATSQKIRDTNNAKENREFLVATKKQAECLARAQAPPIMHNFDYHPQCFICHEPFDKNRRACHCRNCGVCVCNSCTEQWPSNMLPATDNIKNKAFVNICKSCNWVCSTFRTALQEGEYDYAIAMHANGNVNLTTPFANSKGEVFYPIHCAVEGRSLSLLKWLVDENCCPLWSTGSDTGKKKSKNDTSRRTPILTSNSRSLLNIALSHNCIDIIRYLVVEKGMLMSQEKNLPVDKLLQNFDLVLASLPAETNGKQSHNGANDVPQNPVLPHYVHTNTQTANTS